MSSSGPPQTILTSLAKLGSTSTECKNTSRASEGKFGEAMAPSMKVNLKMSLNMGTVGKSGMMESITKGYLKMTNEMGTENSCSTMVLFKKDNGKTILLSIEQWIQ